MMQCMVIDAHHLVTGPICMAGFCQIGPYWQTVLDIVIHELLICE